MGINRRDLVCSMGAGLVLHAAPAQAAKRTLRLAAVLSAASPCGKGVQTMSTQVMQRSNGRLAIDMNMDGSIGSTRDMIQGLVDGSIDIVMAGIDTLGLVFKDAVAPLELAAMPYLFQDVRQARKATDGALGAFCRDVMKDWGIVVLGWPENGVRHMTANKPIRTLADLQGLKLRLPESKVMAQVFASMGASPAGLPFNQLREALRTGRFEAQENPIGNIVGAKLHELHSHVSLTSHAYSTQFIAMPAAVWKDLSGADKTLLQQACKAGVQTSREENERIDKDGLAGLRQAGMTVVDDVDQSSMAQGATRAAAQLATIHGQELVSKIRRLASA